MIFFIVLAVLSLLGFVPFLFFALEIVNNDNLASVAVVSFIFTFVYSVIAIIVIFIKKKDCPNVRDIKAFEKKSILIFCAIFAYVFLFGLVAVIGEMCTVLAFAVLALIFVSLASTPVVIHIWYRHLENNEARKVFDVLTNNNQKNEK